MQTQEQTKLWNKQYILMLVLSTLTAIGFNMVQPVIVKYAISIGATIAISGTIAGIFSITAIFGRPFSGFISDRFNKKKIMIVSTAMLAIASLGYGISHSPSVLLGFRIFHGLAFSISGTAGIALGTTFVPKDRLGEGIGFLGIGYILARAIGPNLGVIALNNFGFFYVFLGAFIVIVTSTLLTFTLKYEHVGSYNKPQKGKKISIKLSDLFAIELLPLVLIAGTFSMMNGIISSFIVSLGEEKNIIGIGIYFTVNALALLLVRPFSGKLLDKKGLAFIAFPGFILAIAAALLLGTASALWMIILAAIFYAFGQGASQPAFQTTCIKKLGLKRVGVATSTYFIGADIGNGLGPMIGGTVAGAFGFSGAYFMGAFVLVLGFIGFFIYRRVNAKKDAIKVVD